MTEEELKKAKVTRPCGGCKACCYVLESKALDMKIREMCQFACEAGCSKWGPDRPNECRKYRCAWAMGLGEEEDRPDLSGVLVDPRKGPRGYSLYAIEVEEETLDALPSIRLALKRISEDSELTVCLLDLEMHEITL